MVPDGALGCKAPADPDSACEQRFAHFGDAVGGVFWRCPVSWQFLMRH